MQRSKFQLVRASVRGLDGRLIDQAKAELESVASDDLRRIGLEFSEALGGHIARDVAPGAYVLTVAAEGLESQRRQVTVGREGLTAIFILGPPDLPFYYRGTVKVPYKPLPLIGASFAGPSSKVEGIATAIATRFQLEAMPVEKPQLDGRVRVFRVPGAGDAERLSQMAAEVWQFEGVRYAGPVVALGDRSVAFLTNEFIVKFKPTVAPDDRLAQITSSGLTVQQSIPYAGNALLVRARDAAGGMDACAALIESGNVEYAEPNLVATTRDDSCTPTDVLFNQQWHLPLVKVPDAWCELQLLNGSGVVAGGPGDLTFGSENIKIAIFDRGIPSQTVGGVVTARHPDFDGNVTSGAPKVSLYFDFIDMVPNNDNTVESHGINCAGIAAALADNPSGVAGENEGVVGAAPNCSVMAIIRDDGGTEKAYADAYIWMAGLDPKVTDPAFPAPLPPGAGADVISNSFGLLGNSGQPVPMSGTMADCFDTLTSDGRDGKGVVLCFSVGDYPSDFVVQRPWAAYDKTIAVASSTDLDTKSSFSAIGFGIDVCAPGGRGLKQLVTCDLPGAGTLAGHTGGNFDYTPFFFGTSASTPLVAGIAALILSANPKLTWSEVLDILRATAVKIDFGNMDKVGQWLDMDGDGVKEYSQWYGYGRVDAKAAVVAAIARRPKEFSWPRTLPTDTHPLGPPEPPRNIRIVK
jgi:subtilisin family serine protease